MAPLEQEEAINSPKELVEADIEAFEAFRDCMLGALLEEPSLSLDKLGKHLLEVAFVVVVVGILH